MVEVIHPTEYSDKDLPTVFLAGPITGAENWQEKAVEFLRAFGKDMLVAIPRRKVWPDPTFDYATQTDWETHYLNQAAARGVILFWLTRQTEPSPDDPRTGFPRIYSQTTRFELAEWKVRKEMNPKINMIVGIEPGFADGDYIERRFSTDCPDVPLVPSLRAACDTAVSLLD